MNALNSIIIEGTVTEVDGENFSISVPRYYKDAEGNNVEHISVFKCKSIRPVKKDKQVRIVGRLHSENGEVSVIVEHMEIRK